jgi:hypothetical protein
MARSLMLLLVVGAVGCKAQYDLGESGTNAAPFADAGTGGTFLVGSTVTLDASGSFDPDGTIRSYRWRISSEPQLSNATIGNDGMATASLTVQVVGEYIVELTVTDNAGAQSTSRVTIVCAGPMIVVDAGADQVGTWRSAVTLAGSAQAELGFPVTLQWTFVLRPAGSAAVLTNPTTEMPSFVPDREGTYVARLTARTSANSASDDVMIEVTVPRQLLSYALVDAEYSTALDRFIIVSTAPPQLHVHDPATGTEAVVNLATAPMSVSVEPGGMRASVGHDGAVTIVNLQTASIAATYSVPVAVTDAVFGADNRVHCFNSGSLRTLDLATSAITISPSGGTTRGRLHPGGAAAYSPTPPSPDDIYHWDVTTSPVIGLRDSPYHGEYRFGGDLWFTQDGFTIIARSRNLFYASTSPAVDMTYRGVLDGQGEINWAVHSPVAGRIATLGQIYDAQFLNVLAYVVSVYDNQFTLLQSITLPTTPVNGTGYFSQGRFAAYRSDGTRLYVITRADTGGGAVFVLYTI